MRGHHLDETRAPRVWVVKAGAVYHYVRVSTRLGTSGPALCGAMPESKHRTWLPLTAIPGDRICNTCHAAASRELAIIQLRAPR